MIKRVIVIILSALLLLTGVLAGFVAVADDAFLLDLQAVKEVCALDFAAEIQARVREQKGDKSQKIEVIYKEFRQTTDSNGNDRLIVTLDWRCWPDKADFVNRPLGAERKEYALSASFRCITGAIAVVSIAAFVIIIAYPQIKKCRTAVQPPENDENTN